MPALFGQEYQALRESVSELAIKKIAPFAHDVDENSRYPQEAADALQAAGFAAAHVPVEFGGQGADALAAVIIIEEVARVCGAASLIPAVNKLGSVPLMIAGNDGQKQKYLTQLAAGKGFSYCLSESEAGSDAAAMKTKAVKEGDSWVLSGSKKWISNAGVSEFYTVLASTDLSKGAKGITAFIVEKSVTALQTVSGSGDVSTAHERILRASAFNNASGAPVAWSTSASMTSPAANAEVEKTISWTYTAIPQAVKDKYVALGLPWWNWNPANTGVVIAVWRKVNDTVKPYYLVNTVYADVK